MKYSHDHPAPGIGRITLCGDETAVGAGPASFPQGDDLKGLIVVCEGNAGSTAGAAGSISSACVPVVACIRGECTGAWLEVAMACDFRIASHDARLGALGAEEALRAAVVSQVTDPSGLERAALALLDSMVTGRSPHLVRAIVESIRNARSMPKAEALRAETRLFLEAARRSWSEDREHG